MGVLHWLDKTGLLAAASPGRKQRVAYVRAQRRRGLLVEALEQRRVLTTFVVTTGDDIVAEDGQLSLREAVMAANLNAAVNADTPAGQPSSDAIDTITFAEGLSVITLNSPLPVSDSLMILLGDAVEITIVGDQTSGLFSVEPGEDAEAATRLTIEGLSLTGGVAVTGGAISVAENQELVLNAVNLFGNTATGDAADQGGGAIFSRGTVTVTDSVIEDNVASGALGSGGGILNVGGVLNVTNTTIQRNFSNRAGGGIEATAGSTTTLTDVDLLDNVTGPEGSAAPGNGGGFHITGDGNAEITGGLIAGNFAALEGGGLWNGSGQMTVTGATIRDNIAAGDGAHDGGGGLFNNGGVLEVFDSLIEDNVASGTLGSGGGILNVGGVLNVTDTIIRRNFSNRAGGGIEATAGSTTTLTDVDLLDNVTGPEGSVGPGNGGGFHITGDGNAEITGGLIAGNFAALEGGGLWNGSGQMTVTGATIRDNFAAGDGADDGGGGLFNNGGVLEVFDSLIEDNVASGTLGSGGGILNVGGVLNITNTTIRRNFSNRAGGGIEATAGSTTTLTDVDLLDNVTGPEGSAAPGNGGGFHITGNGNAEITGGLIAGNFAALEGGGLWNGSGQMTVTGTSIRDNIAAGDGADDGGGGLFNNGGVLEVFDSLIEDNVASGVLGSGGGILNFGGVLNVTDTIIRRNFSNRAGGGIEATAGSTTTLTDVDLLDNVTGPVGSVGPGNGGGFHITGDGNAEITGGLIAGNFAALEGGGLWNGLGQMTVTGATIRDNFAAGDGADDGGGGLFNNGGVLEVFDSLIEDNVASGTLGSGGGILNVGGVLNVTNTTIQRNFSNRAGGGIEATAGSTTTLTDVDLLDNVTGPEGSVGPGNGGGFHITGDGNAEITGGLIEGNFAALEGGGLWNGSGQMTVTGATIRDNFAAGDGADDGGGGLFNNGGVLEVFDSLIEDNVASGTLGSGGGILNVGGVLNVTDTIIRRNFSNRAGGGIEATAGSTTTLTDVDLLDNVTGPEGSVGPGNGGGFHITGDGNAEITGGLIAGNFAALEGGGLWNGSGQMTVTGTTIRDNFAAGDGADDGGGGLFNNGGVLEVFDSLIEDNVASGTLGSGGGILNVGGVLNVTGTIIRRNFSNRAGGGIEATAGSTTTLTDVDLLDNVTGPEGSAAPGNGGGFHITGNGNAEITGGLIAGNFAALEGGGLWNGSGQMTVTGVTIRDNFAAGDGADDGGGGLFNNGGVLEVFDSLIEDNVASGALGSGGGILNVGGVLNVTDTIIRRNFSNRAGGGIEATAGSTTTLTDVDLLDNVTGPEGSAGPGNGGGFHITGNGNAEITGGLIAGNFAALEGGGLWNGSGQMTVTGATIRDNIAAGDGADDGGGGLFNNGGVLEVFDSLIEDNVASGTLGSGGGILNVGGVLNVTDTIIRRNFSNRAGGGIEATAGSTTTLTDVDLLDNVTGPEGSVGPGNGGGFHITGDGNAEITGGLIAGNFAALEGGGLWNGSGQMTVTGATIRDNVAAGAGADDGGGGLFNNGGVLEVFDSLIEDNVASGTLGSGGGILNFGGVLNVTDTIIRRNFSNRAGGGIEATAGSTTTLTDVDLLDNVTGPEGSAAPGNGGGFHITGDGNAEITGGLIAGNFAALEGGGLWNGSGQMTVTGATIRDNFAAGDGADDGGGGLFNNGGVLEVFDSLIEDNVASGVLGSGGGILNFGGVLNVTDTIIRRNFSNRAGGGIEATAGSTTTLTDVDLLDNVTGPEGSAGPGNGGGFHITGDGNAEITGGLIAGNFAALEGGGLWNGSGQMTVTGATIRDNIAAGDGADDGGGGLFNNGGVLEVFDSLIEDNVASGVLGSGGGILNFGGVLNVTDTIIRRNFSNRAGGGIEATAGSTTTLTDVDLLDNVTGPEGNAAPGNGGGFHITGNGNAEITGGLIAGNFAALEGGGLWNGSGQMTVTGTSIRDNIAAGDGADDGGGGLFNNGGVLEVFDSLIEDNVASGTLGSGGGILNVGGVLNVTDTIIRRNFSNRAGGGIEATAGSTTTLTDVDLLDNVTGPEGSAAPGNGGGFHITGNGNAEITGGLIAGNFAALEGGGLWNGSGQMTVTDATIRDNIAAGDGADDGGGGLFNNGGVLEVFDSLIEDNVASGTLGSGGGILNFGGVFNVTGTIIRRNFSNRAGGGIEATAGSTTTLLRVGLNDNVTGPEGSAAPGSGGGLHLTGHGDVFVTESTVSGNTAAADGGGLWNSSSGRLAVIASTISGNVARDGGGIYNDGDGGEIALTNATIAENIASGAGGGIAAEGGSITLTSVTLAFNAAASGGGIAILGGVTVAINTIVAANQADESPDIFGALLSGGHNLIGDSAGANLTSLRPTDLVDVDALLEPLADNGGFTQTVALGAGSPAVDAGVNTGMPIDQRGIERPQGLRFDIGAFELQRESVTPAADTRIIVPEQVAGPHLIAGDVIPRAIIFQATVTSTVTVTPVGLGLVVPQVRILDGDLRPIDQFVDGVTTADVVAGGLYAILFEPQTEDRIFTVRSSTNDALSNSPLTNIISPTDTNADGITTPLDALVILNAIARRNRELALDPEAESSVVMTFLDVNRDGDVTPLDALKVLVHIAEQNRLMSTAAGNGEVVAVPMITASLESQQEEFSHLQTLDRVFAVEDSTDSFDWPAAAAGELSQPRVMPLDPSETDDALKSGFDRWVPETELELIAAS